MGGYENQHIGSLGHQMLGGADHCPGAGDAIGCAIGSNFRKNDRRMAHQYGVRYRGWLVLSHSVYFTLAIAVRTSRLNSNRWSELEASEAFYIGGFGINPYHVGGRASLMAPMDHIFDRWAWTF